MRPEDFDEFKEFLASHAEPSPSIGVTLFSKIHRDLNPPYPMIVLKLFSYHVVGSFVTLLFCPQFGISLTGSEGLMPYLMGVHPALCFFVCGVTWMVVGQALTYRLLTLDEQRVLGRSRVGASPSR